MLNDVIELAWAAGFFEGEGWLYVPPDTRNGLRMHVAQSSDLGQPETLLRFQRAVGDRGRIYKQPANDWSKKQRYQWRLQRRHEVADVIELLRPFMTGDPYVTKVGPKSATRRAS